MRLPGEKRDISTFLVSIVELYHEKDVLLSRNVKACVIAMSNAQRLHNRRPRRRAQQ